MFDITDIELNRFERFELFGTAVVPQRFASLPFRGSWTTPEAIASARATASADGDDIQQASGEEDYDSEDTEQLEKSDANCPELSSGEYQEQQDEQQSQQEDEQQFEASSRSGVPLFCGPQPNFGVPLFYGPPQAFYGPDAPLLYGADGVRTYAAAVAPLEVLYGPNGVRSYAAAVAPLEAKVPQQQFYFESVPASAAPMTHLPPVHCAPRLKRRKLIPGHCVYGADCYRSVCTYWHPPATDSDAPLPARAG